MVFGLGSSPRCSCQSLPAGLQCGTGPLSPRMLVCPTGPQHVRVLPCPDLSAPQPYPALRFFTGRFNERLVLSLASCPNCILMDDELNILPTSTQVSLWAVHLQDLWEGSSVAAAGCI